MDDITGSVGDETIDASAVSSTGSAITTLSSGDSVDGGAGTDTLNITATADDNNSLAGVTVKNVEVINITGANNLDSISTASATAVAGAKQITSVNISNPAPVAEVHVLDFLDALVDTAGTIKIGGAAAQTALGAATSTAATLSVDLEAGDTAEEIATAVAAAIADAETTTGLIDTVVADGSKVVITYLADGGTDLFNPADTAFAATTGSGTAATFDADQQFTAIADALEGSSVDGFVAASNVTGVEVTINGVEYDAGDVSITTADFYSTATDGTPEGSALGASQDARTLAKALINKVLGGSVTATDGNEGTEMLISSKAVGVALPSISVTSQETTISVVDSTDSQAKANAERTSLTTPVAQQQKIKLDKVIDGDAFELYIDGASFGTISVSATAADEDQTTAVALADAINVVLGDGVALAVGDTVTITAPAAGTPLPNITIDYTADDITAHTAVATLGDLATYINTKAGSTLATTASGTDITSTIIDDYNAVDSAVESQARVNVDLAVDVDSTVDGAVSASSFTGSEQIWLKGAASNSTNVTGVGSQTIGLSGVTGMDNSIAYGATVTSATIAVQGSGGDLSMKGAKLAAVTISGTGTAGKTGLVLTDGSTTDTIEAINVAMSAATTLDITAASAVETLTSTGAGGVTLTSTGLETITTGEGADKVTANTVTAKDNANTSADETVSSSVMTGAGADTVVLKTTGTGSTTVDTGAGADYVKWDSASSGDVVVDTGSDNDTVLLVQGTAELTAKSTLNGGAGTDTLISTGGGTITSSVYTMLETVVSGFEVLQFSSLAGNTKAVDASKLSQFSAFTFTTTGANTIEEVDGQTLTLTGVVAVAAADAGYTGAVTGSRGDSLKATAAGYDADGNAANGNQPIYGGDLNVVVAGSTGGTNAVAVALDLFGNTATVSVSPQVAASVDEGYATPDVTLTGDVVNANVSLLSYDYKGTTFGTTLTIAVDSNGESANGTQTLKALETITVTGAGTVSIDTTTSIAAEDVVLTTIDLSGMRALANVDADGDLAFDAGQGTTFDNDSTSSITLDDDVAETVILGGAQDTIVTKSKLDFSDVIEGLELNATAEDAETVDADTSDIIDFTLSGTLYADDTEYANLNIALLAVADLEVSSSEKNEVVFHAEGNTYIYRDTGTNGLTADDVLVTVVGTYDLDLIAQIIT